MYNDTVHFLIQLVIPALQYLVTVGGAGAAATWLIDRARQRWPLPAEQPKQRIAQLVFLALYAPRYVRWTALALAGVISIAAAVVLAAASGQPINVAAAAAFAAIYSQLAHGKTLSAMPRPTAEQILAVILNQDAHTEAH